MNVGNQIGVYRILKILGGGNMGVVYLVEDTEGGGKYALKRLNASLSPSEREVRRFRREFMTLSRLRHPHIVEVHESGFDQGSLYFVMEFVQGPTLRQRFLPGHAPEDPSQHPAWLSPFNTDQRMLDILQMALQICDALSWIHSYGIIHRDLKPENMLLKSEHHIKLLDFGIAKRYGGHDELSQSKSIVGTLTYMSPEQAQCVDVDARSDLYSLGVILYELLTGRPPFVSPEPIGRIYMHLNHQPAPLRQWNPKIDSRVEDVVLRLLAKDPLHRFQRAEDLREALEQVLYSSGVTQLASGEEWSKPALRISDPGFVGRASEQQELLHVVEQLHATRQGAFVLLSGGSGMGKTRLAREIMSSARIQQIECCFARCMKEAPPYTAYQEIVEQLNTSLTINDETYLQHLWGPLLETWSSTLNGAALHDDLDSLTPSLSNAEYEKILMFDTLRQMLERVLVHQPILLVLDDLMFADETSLELTEYLVEHVIYTQQPHPLMIVGIFRNEDVNAEHPLNQCLLRLSAPVQKYRLFDLHSLHQNEVADMATSMLGLPPAPEALHQLMLQSQGIPFFVEELLKAWVEDGQMVEAGDCWYLVSNAFAEEDPSRSWGELPAPLQKRLHYRLQRISPEAYQLATWVGICGQEASFDLLQALTHWSESQLLSCLEQLLQHKILAEDWTAGIERYRFYHPGIPKTLVSALPDAERKEYHFSAAQTLKQFPQTEGSFELLAHHFLAAGDNSQGGWYLLLAAEQQLRALASHRAENLLKRCQTLLSEHPNDPLLQPHSSWWLRYHSAWWEWLEAAGRYKEGLRSVDDALRLYPADMDRSPFWRWQATFHRHTGNYTAALECIQQSLQQAPLDSEWRPHILEEAGRIYRIQGKHNAALDTLREALSWTVQKEQNSQQGRLYGLIGEVLHQKGEHSEAKAYYQQSLEVAKQHNDRHGEIEAVCHVATLELDQGNTSDALQHIEHGLRQAREVGNRRIECIAMTLLGQLAMARQQYDEAQGILRTALTLASDLGTQRMESELLGYLGILFYCTQRYSSARIYLEEGLQKATQVGAHLIELRLRCYLCAVDILQGQRSIPDTIEELQRLLLLGEQSETLEIILLCRILLAFSWRQSVQPSQAEDQLIAARYLALQTGHLRLLAAVEREQFLLSRLS